MSGYTVPQPNSGVNTSVDAEDRLDSRPGASGAGASYRNITGSGHPRPDACGAGGVVELERTPRSAGGAPEGSRERGIRQELAGRSVAGTGRPAGTTNNNSLGGVVATLPTDILSLASEALPSTPGAYLDHWTCNREQHKGKARIVGFGRLRALLQPKHKYFEDRWGEIRWWYRYLDSQEGCDLLFPKVKVFHRENPYRRYQLNRQCAARAAKSVFQLVDQYAIRSPRVVDIETTMPRAMSGFLASQRNYGRDMAWGMNSRFWQGMVDYGLIGEGHARRSNLHPWKSEYPLLPHYHFHELVPNWERTGLSQRRVVRMPEWPCPQCGKAEWVQESLVSWYCATCHPGPDIPEFARRQWARNSKGTLMPWSEAELLLVKALWLDVLLKFARRYVVGGAWQNQDRLMRFHRRRGVKGLLRLLRFMSRDDKGLVDVHVDFVKLNTTPGKARFMHKLGYAGRHWCEDYCYYSNDHPGCPDPPAFLAHYDNRARLFGWWRDIRKFVQLTEGQERARLSPYNAEPMQYLGRYNTEDIPRMHDGNIVLLDVIKGVVVERSPTEDDLEWLRTVDYNRYLCLSG